MARKKVVETVRVMDESDFWGSADAFFEELKLIEDTLRHKMTDDCSRMALGIILAVVEYAHQKIMGEYADNCFRDAPKAPELGFD